MSSDPFDIAKLRIDPATLANTTPRVPAKIRKRRGEFAILPMWWHEKLAKPAPNSRYTCLIAWYLLYLDWRNGHKPFKLASGMLRFDGISRSAKRRALDDIEQRGLVAIKWRKGKSPIVQVHLDYNQK